MIPAVKSWRDRVKVHPAADLLPMMSNDELDALGKDIAENGMTVPVTLWTPMRIEELPRRASNRLPKGGGLLDGRNRLEAIERTIADPEKRAKAFDDALRVGRGGLANLLYGDTDPWTYVISANLHRRHLDREQKRELIAKLLIANAGRSDRATAELAMVSDKTVGVVRAELEARAEIPHVEARTDAAGRQQPATKRPKAVNSETQIRALCEPAVTRDEPRPPRPISSAGQAYNLAGKGASKRLPSQERAGAISAFSKLLHSELPETLDDLTRILSDERSRIAQIPIPKRVVIARGYLQALGVDFDSLYARSIGVDHDRPCS